jgi:hypothetical protein
VVLHGGAKGVEGRVQIGDVGWRARLVAAVREAYLSLIVGVRAVNIILISGHCVGSMWHLRMTVGGSLFIIYVSEHLARPTWSESVATWSPQCSCRWRACAVWALWAGMVLCSGMGLGAGLGESGVTAKRSS